MARKSLGPWSPCPPQSEAESCAQELFLDSPGAASRWTSRIPLFMLPQAKVLRSLLTSRSRAGASKGRASSSGEHTATSHNGTAAAASAVESELTPPYPLEDVPLHGELGVYSPSWDQRRFGTREQRTLTPPRHAHAAGMHVFAGAAEPRPRRCTSPTTHGSGSSAGVHLRAERAGQRPGQPLIERPWIEQRRVPRNSPSTIHASHGVNKRVLGARVAAKADARGSGPRASGAPATAPPRRVLHAKHTTAQAAEEPCTRGHSTMRSVSPPPAPSFEKPKLAGRARLAPSEGKEGGTLGGGGDARRGGREENLAAMVKELEEEREGMRRVLAGKEVSIDLNPQPKTSPLNPTPETPPSEPRTPRSTISRCNTHTLVCWLWLLRRGGIARGRRSHLPYKGTSLTRNRPP